MIYESEADELVLIASALSLANPDPDLLDRVDPTDFVGVRGEVWRIARALHSEGKSVTPRAITSAVSNPAVDGVLKAVRGQTFPSGRVVSAESTVRELALLRRLEGALIGAHERLSQADSYSEALEAAHAELSRLDQTQPSKTVREFGDALDTWMERMQTPQQKRPAIPTPWANLNDRLAGGLHRGRTYVVGGRPGEGKSLAGANLAQFAAEQGFPVAVFSVEMDEHEVMSRFLAAGAQAEYGQITAQNIDDYNWSKIAEYADGNHHIPLRIIDKPDISVEYVSAVCRTEKRTRGLDVIFVDYLQLLRESDSKMARERQVAMISRGLKILARELDCAVIIACQLNRNAANEKRPPQLSDLRESGSIEQDCDVAILLHHHRNEDGSHTGDLDLVVAKNRTGACGSVGTLWKAYQARIA